MGVLYRAWTREDLANNVSIPMSLPYMFNDMIGQRLSIIARCLKQRRLGTFGTLVVEQHCLASISVFSAAQISHSSLETTHPPYMLRTRRTAGKCRV
jgi:hypothetical protein